MLTNHSVSKLVGIFLISLGIYFLSNSIIWFIVPFGIMLLFYHKMVYQQNVLISQLQAIVVNSISKAEMLAKEGHYGDAAKIINAEVTLYPNLIHGTNKAILLHRSAQYQKKANNYSLNPSARIDINQYGAD